MMQLSKRLLVCVLTLLCCALVVFAQTETGQITGTILDPSGAAIPGAAVTARDLSTNATREAKTPDGTYQFSNLLPGRYELTAKAAGFTTLKQVVNLTVGARVGVDLRLEVGTQSTVVQVSESGVQVNTETQTVGQNISGSEILNLPTITRNPYDLVKTVGNTTSADPAAQSRGVGVSINGLRSSDVSILLDGVSNYNQFDSTVAITTPLDSVGEVTVLTNNFTAEYGHALAGVVNVDTRRGSNQYHGTAYEFNRVSALTSNTFDNNANGIPVSVFTRNQFGFSAGGPVVKDKLFVFGNPEWIRVRSSAIVTGDIATPQLIAASAPATQTFFSTYGKLRSDLMQLQTYTYGQACTSAACTVLPASTPAYQKVAWTVPADSGGGSPQNTLLFAGRADYVLSDKTQFYFRYARLDENDFNGTVETSPYIGYDTGQTTLDTAYAVSATHTFSPTLVSQSKVSFNRVDGPNQPLGTAPIGPTPYTTANSTSSLGGSPILYPGYNAFTPGSSIPVGGPQNYVQINEDVSKALGKHNLRFGGLFTYFQNNRTFGAYEEAIQPLGTSLSTAVNNLLAGQAHEFNVAINPQGKFPCVNGPTGPIETAGCTLTFPVGSPSFSRSYVQREAGLYFQDNWKIRPRITLNLGLRWEYFGPQANKNPNLDSNFYPGTGTNIELAAGTGQVLLSTDPKNPIGGSWAKDWHDFSPRIGIAWDVFGNGKTAVRGGYGIGWTPNFGNVTFNMIQNPPNYAVVDLIAGTDVPTIPITIDNLGPFAGTSGSKALGRTSLRAVDPNIQTAYAHLWSASIEHQFSSNFIGAIEYSGSKGVHLYDINRMNIPGSALVYGGTGSGSGSPADYINPQYGLINSRTNGGFSHYNGVNFRAETRNLHGLTMRMNYTWSHAIDNASNTFSEFAGVSNLGLLDPLNPALDKGSSEYDVRHRFNVAAVWEEPYKSKSRALNAALGGWSIVPNFIARTGTPFTLSDCTNALYALCPRAMYDTPFQAAYTQTPTATPNVFNYMSVGTPDTSYVNAKLAAVGVDASDFGPFPGNMTGRSAFRAPGMWNIDFAVHKNFDLTERFKLQFRAEAFNLFNHSNLYVVYSNLDVSATSYVTAQKGTYYANTSFSGSTTENRNLQLALKLIF